MKKIALIITLAIAALSIESCCEPCKSEKVYKYQKGEIVTVAGRQFLIKYTGNGNNDDCNNLNEKTYYCKPWLPADGDSMWISESSIDSYNDEGAATTTQPEADTLGADSTYY